MAAKRGKIWIVPVVLCLFVAALWVFPGVWYTKQGAGQAVWLVERSAVDGWEYVSIPISESAERVLVGRGVWGGASGARHRWEGGGGGLGADGGGRGECGGRARPGLPWPDKRYGENARELFFLAPGPDG